MQKQIKSSHPREEPVKGDWHSPVQRQQAFLYQWQRLVVEPINLKEIESKPIITYFNRTSLKDIKCEYDIRYKFSLEFDPKVRRDDRHNTAVNRNNIRKEESERAVPVISSQNFGHRKYNLEGRTLKSYKRMRLME